jgi:hypothetical protein
MKKRIRKGSYHYSWNDMDQMRLIALIKEVFSRLKDKQTN